MDPHDAFEIGYLKGHKLPPDSFIFMRDTDGDYINIFIQQRYWHFLKGWNAGQAAMVAEKGL